MHWFSSLYITADSFLFIFSLIFLLLCCRPVPLWWFHLSLQMYRYSYTASYIIYNIYTRWAGFTVCAVFDSWFFMQQCSLKQVHGACWYISVCIREVWELNPPEVQNAVLQHAAWGRQGQQLVRLSLSISFPSVSSLSFRVHATLPLRRDQIRWSALMWLFLQYKLWLHTHCAVSVCSESVWLVCHWPNSDCEGFYITLDTGSISYTTEDVCRRPITVAELKKVQVTPWLLRCSLTVLYGTKKYLSVYLLIVT